MTDNVRKHGIVKRANKALLISTGWCFRLAPLFILHRLHSRGARFIVCMTSIAFGTVADDLGDDVAVLLSFLQFAAIKQVLMALLCSSWMQFALGFIEILLC